MPGCSAGYRQVWHRVLVSPDYPPHAHALEHRRGPEEASGGFTPSAGTGSANAW